MSPGGQYFVHKKNGEFVGNERRERGKSACIGDRKTDREKRVRLQRQTVGERKGCNSATASARFVPPPLSYTRTTHPSFFQKT